MSSNPPIPLRTGSRVYESTQRSFGTGSSASKSEIEAYDTFIREHRERDTRRSKVSTNADDKPTGAVQQPGIPASVLRIREDIKPGCYDDYNVESVDIKLSPEIRAELERVQPNLDRVKDKSLLLTGSDVIQRLYNVQLRRHHPFPLPERLQKLRSITFPVSHFRPWFAERVASFSTDYIQKLLREEQYRLIKNLTYIAVNTVFWKKGDKMDPIPDYMGSFMREPKLHIASGICEVIRILKNRGILFNVGDIAMEYNKLYGTTFRIIHIPSKKDMKNTKIWIMKQQRKGISVIQEPLNFFLGDINVSFAIRKYPTPDLINQMGPKSYNRYLNGLIENQKIRFIRELSRREYNQALRRGVKVTDRDSRHIDDVIRRKSTKRIISTINELVKKDKADTSKYPDDLFKKQTRYKKGLDIKTAEGRRQGKLAIMRILSTVYRVGRTSKSTRGHSQRLTKEISKAQHKKVIATIIKNQNDEMDKLENELAQLGRKLADLEYEIGEPNQLEQDVQTVEEYLTELERKMKDLEPKLKLFNDEPIRYTD